MVLAYFHLSLGGMKESIAAKSSPRTVAAKRTRKFVYLASGFFEWLSIVELELHAPCNLQYFVENRLFDFTLCRFQSFDCAGRSLSRSDAEGGFLGRHGGSSHAELNIGDHPGHEEESSSPQGFFGIYLAVCPDKIVSNGTLRPADEFESRDFLHCAHRR